MEISHIYFSQTIDLTAVTVQTLWALRLGYLYEKVYP